MPSANRTLQYFNTFGHRSRISCLDSLVFVFQTQQWPGMAWMITTSFFFGLFWLGTSFFPFATTYYLCLCGDNDSPVQRHPAGIDWAIACTLDDSTTLPYAEANWFHLPNVCFDGSSAVSVEDTRSKRRNSHSQSQRHLRTTSLCSRWMSVEARRGASYLSKASSAMRESLHKFQSCLCSNRCLCELKSWKDV